jgi:MFS family permease
MKEFMATLTQAENPIRTNTYSALRSPNFRLYFFGQLVSISGTWMQNVAQGYLVFNITRSELWLGIVALAAGIPMIIMSPIAGVVVENVPRRTLLMVTQTIQMLLAFILTALTFTGLVEVWHIVLLAFCLGITNALDMPARQTFVVEMVGREDLHSGIALNSILNSAARVLGPTLAGLALVKFGVAWCFFINGATFLAVLVSLFIMDVPFAIQHVKKTASALSQLKEGFGFARHDPIVAPLLLMACLIGLFIVPIIQLLPAFADLILHSPKEGYAAMSSAQGVGSVIGGLAIGGLAYRMGYGRLIAVSIAFGALSLILMARQTLVPLAAFASGLSGLFLILQAVSLNTLIQTTVPDEFRGRVLSLYTLAFLGVAPIGALLLGALASAISTATAVGLYGVLSGLGGGLIILRWPQLVLQKHVS